MVLLHMFLRFLRRCFSFAHLLLLSSFSVIGVAGVLRNTHLQTRFGSPQFTQTLKVTHNSHGAVAVGQNARFSLISFGLNVALQVSGVDGQVEVILAANHVVSWTLVVGNADAVVVLRPETFIILVFMSSKLLVKR